MPCWSSSASTWSWSTRFPDAPDERGKGPHAGLRLVPLREAEQEVGLRERPGRMPMPRGAEPFRRVPRDNRVLAAALREGGRNEGHMGLYASAGLGRSVRVGAAARRDLLQGDRPLQAG